MRARPWVLCAVALALAGCDALRSAPRCASPDQVLASAGAAALTCADVGRATSYVEALAARPLPGPERLILEDALVARFHAPGWGGVVEQADAVVASFAELRGLPAAEIRSQAAAQALAGEGPLGADPEVLRLLKRAIGPWSTQDGLVLTEMDIEGWIAYASLCREVQGAGALRLSVADRQVVYRLVVEAFGAADRPGRIAIVGLGAFWPSVKEAWAAASYDEQQAWIRAAPLPPPMTATSLGYVEAVLSGPLTAHVAELHARLGPLSTGVAR